MKYRIHKWHSVARNTTSYGIEAQKVKGARFRHCCADIGGVNRALIYDSEERALDLVIALNQGENPELTAGLVPLVN